MSDITLATAPAILRQIADLLDAQPTTTTTAAPTPVEGIRFPTGTIKTPAPNGSLRWAGVPWSRVARWEPIFTRAGEEFGIAPLLLAAFALVESDAQHYRTGNTTGDKDRVVVRLADAYDAVPTVGMMQVKLVYHAATLPDADGYTPLGNVRIAAKLLAGWIRELGSWEKALTTKYHPGDDPQSGVTQQEYIRAIRRIIAEVKGETTTTTAPSRNPFREPPIIHDLSMDWARYGLTITERNKILGNRFTNRNNARPRYIVNHIQDGTTPGSLNWWARGPGVQASSTVMAQRDGSILRIIPEQHAPWTNGLSCQPTPKSAGLLNLGGNPNIWCLTLEAEGKPGIGAVSYTDAQLESICWQFSEWMVAYDIPLANVLSHASIDQCNRANCPGESNQIAVINKLRQAGFK